MRSDEQLVSETLAGSDQAFEGLVLRYEGKIYGFLLRFAGNASDAEDLAQQTFIRAYRRLQRFDARYRFSTWLFTIARNLAIGHYRRRGKEIPEESPELATDRTPASDMAARESVEDIWTWARGELSPHQFTALWLHVQEELPVKEVACAMGKTVTHAKVLIHRARRNLVRSRTRYEMSGTESRSKPAHDRPAWAAARAAGGESS